MSVGVRTRRFSVEEYHQMVRAGILKEDDRVELIEGEIIETTPIGPRHSFCVARLTDHFAAPEHSRAPGSGNPWHPGSCAHAGLPRRSTRTR